MLTAAHATAQRFNAHVNVAFIGADPQAAIPYLGEGISEAGIEGLIAQAASENAKLAGRARAEFNEWREAVGILSAEPKRDQIAALETEAEVPTCSWQEIVGVSSISTTSAASLADLVISSRGDTSGETENELLIERALMESGRPLLLAPSTRLDEIGNRITIAWDGSAEAARAIGVAMPFLRAAKSVNALKVTE